MPPISQSMASPVWGTETYAPNQNYPMADYLYPQWSTEQSRGGLTHEQQTELMQTFEENETSKIQAMIEQSNQLFRPYFQTH